MNMNDIKKCYKIRRTLNWICKCDNEVWQRFQVVDYIRNHIFCIIKMITAIGCEILPHIGIKPKWNCCRHFIQTEMI